MASNWKTAANSLSAKNCNTNQAQHYTDESIFKIQTLFSQLHMAITKNKNKKKTLKAIYFASFYVFIVFYMEFVAKNRKKGAPEKKN